MGQCVRNAQHRSVATRDPRRPVRRHVEHGEVVVCAMDSLPGATTVRGVPEGALHRGGIAMRGRGKGDGVDP